MNYINKFLEKYNLNIDELIILMVSATAFLPFYFMILVLFGVLFYLMVTEKIIYIFKNTKDFKYILIFAGLITLNALYHRNTYGIGASIITFLMMIFFMYYRLNINRKLFAKIINVYMIISTICFTLTIFSVFYYKFTLKLSLYEFIEYLSLHRPISSFFNTNYYATICEFIIIISMYYFLSNKNRNARIYFLTVSTLAFIVLFLTENRTALPTILIASIILSLTKKNKKVLIFMIMFTVIITILMFYSNKIFPRYEFIGNSFGTRMNIWKNSIKLFKGSPLFGYGLMAYQNAAFKSYPANHAHNIVLDLLINFGIVGILVLFPLYKRIIKCVYEIRNKNMFRLVIALTCIVVLHGMFDVTIFWHQTAFIYLSVLLTTNKISNLDTNFIFRRKL